MDEDKSVDEAMRRLQNAMKDLADSGHLKAAAGSATALKATNRDSARSLSMHNAEVGVMMSGPLSWKPAHMTPTELNRALHTIDELLIDAESMHGWDDKLKSIVRQSFSRQREEIILRLWEHTSAKSASSLKELINNLPDDEQRNILEAELEDLQRETSKLKEETRQGIAQRDYDETMLRTAALNAKWDVWSKILARESIATLVGSLLLVGLATTLVIGMFTGAKSSDIVNNTFLIVLGYFFGNNSGKQDRTDGPRRSD